MDGWQGKKSVAIETTACKESFYFRLHIIKGWMIMYGKLIKRHNVKSDTIRFDVMVCTFLLFRKSSLKHDNIMRFSPRTWTQLNISRVAVWLSVYNNIRDNSHYAYGVTNRTREKMTVSGRGETERIWRSSALEYDTIQYRVDFAFY